MKIKEDKLEWKKLWDAMDKDPEKWIPTTEKMYWKMLNCLPPMDMSMGAFLVGEPSHDNDAGEAVYVCFKEVRGLGFKARYMTGREFKGLQLVRS